MRYGKEKINEEKCTPRAQIDKEHDVDRESD